MAKTPTSQEEQDRAHLTRTVESVCKIDNPNEHDKRFRATLFARVLAELKDFTPAAVIRMHQSACDIKYADQECAAFRLALQRVIGQRFDLKSYRSVQKP